jgi:hypothetical protein
MNAMHWIATNRQTAIETSAARPVHIRTMERLGTRTSIAGAISRDMMLRG